MGSSSVSSAPSSSKHRMKETQSTTMVDAMKRSSSCIEGKYKTTITSERLNRLRKMVDTAVKERKIFTIKGGWPVLRKELLKRNWVEKIEPSIVKPRFAPTTTANNDDLLGNLPAKQDGESPSAYVEKCEKTIMSRMLQNMDVEFYWNMRKDQSDNVHRSNTYKIMSRFSKSLFASKEGLALILQQAYWFCEPGVAQINFPRCYVLGFPDHFNNFIDDFRLTACTGLLKWLIIRHDAEGKFGVVSPDGRIPLSALNFALQRCTEYLEQKKHFDIDKDYERVWDHEWDQFLSNYYLVVHGEALFLEHSERPLSTFYSKAKAILNELMKYCPEINMDGMKNIWIIKPGNKCRGRGIQLIKNIGDVEKVFSMKLKYVVQKYIEKPLLIYNTKFDIRQWFIVASTQPLTIWMYRESYLRFSSQIFTLDNFHESLHLTNYAVQCKYTNVEQRDRALPQDNMWDCHTFQNYLKQIGCKDRWEDLILPGMRESIICAMLASQEVMDRRPNTFELYGADFMISEDFRPWLIEINCCPDLSGSTSVTRKMCPQCLEDIVKVVIDRRRDANAETGLFDMVYKQSLPRIPPYLGMNLSIRGRKIFRKSSKSKSHQKENVDFPVNGTNNFAPQPQFLGHPHKKYQDARDGRAVLKRPTTFVPEKNLPQVISVGGYREYKGPVIEDLIEDISSRTTETRRLSPLGVEFKPAVVITKVDKKKPDRKDGERRDRVSRKGGCRTKSRSNSSFFCRKPSARESSGHHHQEISGHLGLFKEWASLHDLHATTPQRDRGTVSILKGKNVLNRANGTEEDASYASNNGNKRPCLKSTNLNHLLPHINTASSGTANVIFN